MVGGLIIKNRKREGFFCKRIKRMEGLFWKKRKRGGALGKIALLPPLSRTEQRRGAYGGGPRRRPRAWRRPGGGGKERGERGGSIPPTTSGWGGAVLALLKYPFYYTIRSCFGKFFGMIHVLTRHLAHELDRF